MLGISLRAIWMVFTDSPDLEPMFLIGKDYSFFSVGALYIITGIFFLLLGYSMRPVKWNFRNYFLFKRRRWSTTKMFIVVGILTVMSMYGIYTFIQKLGLAQLTIDVLSQKRFFEVGDSDTKSAGGYVRWSAMLGQISFIIYFIWFAEKRKSWLSFYGLFAVFQLILAITFPLITSARVGIVAVFLWAMIIWNYMRKISIISLASGGIIVLFLILMVSAFRPGLGKAKSLGDAVEKINLEYLGDIFVGNRNLMGIDKTSHIIAAIPSKIPYQYGKTMFSWVFAPIPRSIWPGKPPITPGGQIAEEIYHFGEGAFGGGIPPSLIAEFYMNFGILGIIFGMFFIGLFLKFTYASLGPYMTVNKNALALYVIITYNLCFLLFSVSITQSIINFLLGIIPLVFSLLVISRR